jgi:6-phosphofructokinase 1
LPALDPTFLAPLTSYRPSPFITTNNFGGGFVSNDDKVALSALTLSSDENPHQGPVLPCPSAAELNKEIFNANGSMEEVCMPIPSWARRAGARETIYLNPAEAKIASTLTAPPDFGR